MKYRYIKLKEISGDYAEYEDCEMYRWFGKYIILHNVPLGTVKTEYIASNLIYVDALPYEKSGKEN